MKYMKKKITIILLIFLGIVSGIIIKNILTSNSQKEKLHISLEYDTSLGKDIYVVKTNNDEISIYDEQYQNLIQEEYKTLSENTYTFEEPLLIYNLYGTNKLGLNIKFTSTESAYLNYKIEVEGFNDFSKTLKNDGKNNLAKNHEYQIIGFVKGYVNTLILDLKDKNDKTIATKEIKIDLSAIKTDSQLKAEVTTGKSKQELAEGLYTILGNDSDTQDYVAMYDNDGILRSEIPIIGYRAHQILFKDNYMYFSISQSKIVKMSRTGKIDEIYTTGHYHLHHDYTFTEDGNLIVLANNLEKDTEEDCIIKIDLETKEVKELIDFETMFESYVETCYWDKESARDEGEDGLDWLHLNSIEYVDGDVFLSSRETSSIIKINNIEEKPELEYIIADKEIWADTEFSDYVYKKVGNFKIHAGQHSVRYIKTSKDYIYYLAFFNNNYGKATSKPDFDYTTIGITNQNAFTGDNSYYYLYKVNEKEKTFKLVDSIELTYSGIVSSIQHLDNKNILTDSGTAGVYAEYDSNHKLIKSFSLDLNKYMLYRVLKYDYKELWFN